MCIVDQHLVAHKPSLYNDLLLVYQDPDLMAAFSDPEVMAALQDGMFLASRTNLVMLVYYSSLASYFLWYQNRISCLGHILVLNTDFSFTATE
jgi:hypothetical protein